MATGNDAAFGFAVWDKLIRANLYAVNTAPTINIYHNDLVVAGGANVITTKGGPLMDIADAAVPDGNPGILGSVLAIFDENMDPVKRIVAAEAGDSTVAGYVLVADSPDQLFLAQEDSGGNAITLTEGSMNADIVSQALCAGNSTTGRSLQEIDSDTAANTAALQVKIMMPHYLDTPGSDYCRYIVQINEHYYGDTIAGIA
jgi:hypothetical protein